MRAGEERWKEQGRKEVLKNEKARKQRQSNRETEDDAPMIMI